MMCVEAILRQRPEELQEVLEANSLMGLKTAGFFNTKTGLMQKEDPRVAPFLHGLVQQGLVKEASLQAVESEGAAVVLEKASLGLQWFILA
jgi:hypothetical protein